MKDFFTHQYKYDGTLALRYHTDSDGCLALVDTTQVATLYNREPQRLLSWLSDEENLYRQRFRFPKRHNEWLSGRIAAKCCLMQSMKPTCSRQHPSEFSILPDAHGRPILSPAPADHMDILSISHSRRYAVAMTADQACGIDIQHIGLQILRVRDRFATDREIALVQHFQPGGIKAGLTLLWAVKEAVKKLCLPDQPGLFEAISIEQLLAENTKNSWKALCRLTADNQSQPVNIVCLGQYMMAWCRR